MRNTGVPLKRSKISSSALLGLGIVELVICESRHLILQTASDLIEIERPHLEADIQVSRGNVE